MVLLSALVLRALTALGVVPLPPMGAVPLAIGMALGVWELVLVVATLQKVGARRQLRHHYRTPTDMAAFIGDDMVRMVDLTPTGAGLLGPRQLALGQQVLLVADLPMADGRPHSARLQLTVASCRPDAESARLADRRRARSSDRRRPRHPRGVLPRVRGAVPPHRERAHGRGDRETGAPRTCRRPFRRDGSPRPCDPREKRNREPDRVLIGPPTVGGKSRGTTAVTERPKEVMPVLEGGAIVPGGQEAAGFAHSLILSAMYLVAAGVVATVVFVRKDVKA